jgi:hypothetical protein
MEIGIARIVTVSLDDLPKYLADHQLEPMTKGEVRDVLAATGQPHLQALYVKPVRNSDGQS